MAHAEASARTVDAAVTAAAAQLGLRSDQVDVEVLEEPVPSTFGFIGSPARVRVTARTTPSSIGSEPGGPSTTSDPTGAAGRGSPEPVSGAGGGSAGGGTGLGGPAGGVLDAGERSAGGGSGPVGAGPELHPTDHSSAQEASNEANVSNDAAPPSLPASVSAAPTIPTHPPATVTEVGNGQVPTGDSTQPRDQLAVQTQERSTSSPRDQLAAQTEKSSASSQERLGLESVTESATGLMASGPSATPDASTSAASAPDTSISAASAASPAPDNISVGPDSPASAPPTPPPAVPDAAASPSPLSTPEAASTPSTISASPSVIAPETSRREAPGSGARGTRPPRRSYKDEPIEPQMVEEDTERAGDFLEGLLDALDVDGDITTWVDEVGGHIDLEGTDLEVLVGSNGETLDALQELTRLAVLRQSKRRVRLLIDINGFRARQREQLTSMVRATVEQVIRTREDHELQPMSPAERKIIHDAVAAIEGARTESLGEEPNRRVVIRPA